MKQVIRAGPPLSERALRKPAHDRTENRCSLGCATAPCNDVTDDNMEMGAVVRIKQQFTDCTYCRNTIDL
jgi:hypothetical protein